MQGLWLRFTATRLPEASGDRTGVNGQGAKLHLLAMGDSIIAGVGTGTMDRSLPVQFGQALAEDRACCVHWRVEVPADDYKWYAQSSHPTVDWYIKPRRD